MSLLTVDVPLIDHHCHFVVRGAMDLAAVESMITESDRPPPPGCSFFDSLLGLAVRERCAPALGLAAGASPDEYIARRAELGGEESNRRLLRAARLEAVLVDTGLAGAEMVDCAELAQLSGARTYEVVRLESIAEEVAASCEGAAAFAPAFTEALGARAARAVGLKSVIAYRHGLEFEPGPPSATEVRAAADRWLAGGGGRLDDVALLRFLLWEGLATGLPLQLHTGFGDPDEDLRRCDPALLTGFLRACGDRGAPVLLLHTYPYHRHAAYLANVYPHVYLDVGLAIPYVGARAAAVLAETLELAPFHKLLYSSDAYGLAELYLLGSALFRDALGEVLPDLGVRAGDRQRIASLIGVENARRVYSLTS